MCLDTFTTVVDTVCLLLVHDFHFIFTLYIDLYHVYFSNFGCVVVIVMLSCKSCNDGKLICELTERKNMKVVRTVLDQLSRIMTKLVFWFSDREQDNSLTRQLTDTVFETIHRQILRQLTDTL